MSMVRHRAVAISVTSLLLLSTFVGILSVPERANAASPATPPGANWQNTNYDLNGTNSSPQTLLGPGNANTLRMSWIMPFGPNDPTWKQAKGAKWSVEPGSDTPPLVVDGFVYVATNQGTVYALGASSGSQIWSWRV